MKSYNVDSFQKFHKVVQGYDEDTIYRGVSRCSFKLIPKVGRKYCSDNYNYNNKYNDLSDYELDIIQKFRKLAFPFLDYSPSKEAEWWEWWAIAQHHGLPTRFLDWSINPLVAAYFAIEDCNQEEDAIVYAVDSNQFNSDIDFENYQLPLDVEEIFLYRPPHINKRITAQSGIFTIHNYPTLPLDETEKPRDKIVKKIGEKYNVDRIIKSKGCKKELKKTLSLYGINKSTIYPGLDGIASYLEWKTLDCH